MPIAAPDGWTGGRLLQLGRAHEIADQMVYADVDDVDRVYADLKPVLDTLPQGHVRGPIDQDHGQPELHVKDLDNCLLMFGREIGGKANSALVSAGETP